jgi:hypothetical protein
MSRRQHKIFRVYRAQDFLYLSYSWNSKTVPQPKPDESKKCPQTFVPIRSILILFSCRCPFLQNGSFRLGFQIQNSCTRYLRCIYSTRALHCTLPFKLMWEWNECLKVSFPCTRLIRSRNDVTAGMTSNSLVPRLSALTEASPTRAECCLLSALSN